MKFCPWMVGTIVGLLAGIVVVSTAFVFVDFRQHGDEQKPDYTQKISAEWLATPQTEEAGVMVKTKTKPRNLTVGVIGPLSGPEAEFGQAVLAGISIAADRFNNLGGFQGEAVKVVSYDNNGGSGQALDITEKLIAQNVVAIFSAPTGWSTFAPTHTVNASETVFISIGTRRKIGKSGGYIFRLALPDEIAIEKLLSYAISTLGYKNLALVSSSSYDYSLAVSAEFKRKVPVLGGRILVEPDTYDTFSGKTEIGKVADELNVKSDELQAIIFTGNVDEAVELALAIQELELTIPLIGGEDLFDEKFLKKGGKAVQGSLLYTAYAPDLGSALMRDFKVEYLAQRNTNPDRFAALAFDAFNLLSQALKNADSLETKVVRDALLNLEEIDGVTGISRWAPDGTPVKYPSFYRVVGGPTGEEFVLVE